MTKTVYWYKVIYIYTTVVEVSSRSNFVLIASLYTYSSTLAMTAARRLGFDSIIFLHITLSLSKCANRKHLGNQQAEVG